MFTFPELSHEVGTTYPIKYFFISSGWKLYMKAYLYNHSDIHQIAHYRFKIGLIS